MVELSEPECGKNMMKPGCALPLARYHAPEHGDDGERLANLKGWASGKDTYIELGTFGSQDGE